MTWWKCPHCGRRGEAVDARQGFERGDRDQPGYVYDGCRICTPDADDDEAAEDAKWDRRIHERLEGLDS